MPVLTLQVTVSHAILANEEATNTYTKGLQVVSFIYLVVQPTRSLNCFTYWIGRARTTIILSTCGINLETHVSIS